MILHLALIRPGKTNSGNEGRTLGSSDEPLIKEEAARLDARVEQGIYPPSKLVYSSPLYRCRETALLLYPQSHVVVLNNLRALDIGTFEGHTHEELQASEQLRSWPKESATDACPEGEDFRHFNARCIQAFRAISQEMCSKGIDSAAVVTHNLVIGSILRRFCIPRSTYRDWDIGWGEGYAIEYNSVQFIAKLESVF